MQSLSRTVTRHDTSGTPLPTVYSTLQSNGIQIRGGELTVIAGQPGSGKSTLALDLAVKMRLPTLYMSADSHAWTMAVRLGSLLTGHPISKIERHLQEEPARGAAALSVADYVRWVFDSSPTLEDIDLELAAYEEVMGQPPKVIVIDNLMDVTFDDNESEFSSMRKVMKELKWMARDTGAAVIVLHHTSEGTQGAPCPPRSAVQGKVNQLPAVILTIHYDQATQFLGVCPVKNRYGPAYPNGDKPVWLNFHPETVQIGDLR